ncbi:hypothetical protein AYO46_07495 [Betaproteobacteria bacterium SCGC AG-212-J23]|nr:hypothetical protein AYO46_07495 [Betaproteobacteria bacterium SCGC AG-212-J23]
MADSVKEIHLWFWEFTDDFGKRRRSSWRMTEESAAKYRDAVKIEGTLEVRNVTGAHTSDWQRQHEQ